MVLGYYFIYFWGSGTLVLLGRGEGCRFRGNRAKDSGFGFGNALKPACMTGSRAKNYYGGSAQKQGRTLVAEILCFPRAPICFCVLFRWFLVP